jgi:hypothetical protein
VISGARPVPLRRVNYYEDFQFMGLFDPHPDHPFIGPKELTLEASALGPLLKYFGDNGLGIFIAEWKIRPGQIVAAGEPAALVSSDGKTCVTGVRVPRAGMISAVQGGGNSKVPTGPLFSMRYFEDSAGMSEPFGEIAAWMERIRVSLRQQLDAENKKVSKIAGVMVAAILLAVIFGLVVWGDGGAALMGGLVLAVAIPVGIKISKNWIELTNSLKKYFGE